MDCFLRKSHCAALIKPLAVSSRKKAIQIETKKDNAMADHEVLNTGAPLQKIIELKLPLPWLLTLIGSIALSVATMWFRGEKAAEEITALRADIKELRSDLKQRDLSLVSVDRGLAILTVRIEATEHKVKALEASKSK